MAQKRRRDAEEGGSYQHFIALDDDILNIHFREGRLQNKKFMAPSTRITQKSNEYWNVAETWGPLDDPEFALDSDGALYNEALDAPVMQDTTVSVTAVEKKARSQVSVSLLSPFTSLHLYLFLCDRDVRTLSGKNLIVPLTCTNCYELLVVGIFDTQRSVLTAFPVEWVSLVCLSTAAGNVLFPILHACRAAFNVIGCYLFIGSRCVFLIQWRALH